MDGKQLTVIVPTITNDVGINVGALENNGKGHYVLGFTHLVALHSGLKIGDQVVSINGQLLAHWMSRLMIMGILTVAEQSPTIEFLVLRHAQDLLLKEWSLEESRHLADTVLLGTKNWHVIGSTFSPPKTAVECAAKWYHHFCCQAGNFKEAEDRVIMQMFMTDVLTGIYEVDHSSLNILIKKYFLKRTAVEVFLRWKLQPTDLLRQSSYYKEDGIELIFPNDWSTPSQETLEVSKQNNDSISAEEQSKHKASVCEEIIKNKGKDSGAVPVANGQHLNAGTNNLRKAASESQPEPTRSAEASVKEARRFRASKNLKNGTLTFIVRGTKMIGLVLAQNSVSEPVVIHSLKRGFVESFASKALGNSIKILGSRILQIGNNAASQMNILEIHNLIQREKRPFKIVCKIPDFWLQDAEQLKHSQHWVGRRHEKQPSKLPLSVRNVLLYLTRLKTCGFNWSYMKRLQKVKSVTTARLKCLKASGAGYHWGIALMATVVYTTSGPSKHQHGLSKILQKQYYEQAPANGGDFSRAMWAIYLLWTDSTKSSASKEEMVKWILVNMKTSYFSARDFQLRMFEMVLSIQQLCHLGLADIKDDSAALTSLEELVKYMQTDSCLEVIRSTLGSDSFGYQQSKVRKCYTIAFWGQRARVIQRLSKDGGISSYSWKIMPGPPPSRSKDNNSTNGSDLTKAKVTSPLSKEKLNEQPLESQICLLCPHTAGPGSTVPWVQVANLSGVVVHRLCAGVLRLPLLENEDPCQVTLGTAHLADQAQSVCVFCYQTGGALMRCAIEGCNTWAHPMCALKKNKFNLAPLKFQCFCMADNAKDWAALCAKHLARCRPYRTCHCCGKKKVACVPCGNGVGSSGCGEIYCAQCIKNVQKDLMSNVLDPSWLCYKCSGTCRCAKCKGKKAVQSDATLETMPGSKGRGSPRKITKDTTLPRGRGDPPKVTASEGEGERKLFPCKYCSKRFQRQALGGHTKMCKNKEECQKQMKLANPEQLSNGSKVRVSWPGNDQFYKATICEDHCQPQMGGATYSVLYEDGSYEVDVTANRLFVQVQNRKPQKKMGTAKKAAKWQQPSSGTKTNPSKFQALEDRANTPREALEQGGDADEGALGEGRLNSKFKVVAEELANETKALGSGEATDESTTPAEGQDQALWSNMRCQRCVLHGTKCTREWPHCSKCVLSRNRYPETPDCVYPEKAVATTDQHYTYMAYRQGKQPNPTSPTPKPRKITGLPALQTAEVESDPEGSVWSSMRCVQCAKHAKPCPRQWPRCSKCLISRSKNPTAPECTYPDEALRTLTRPPTLPSQRLPLRKGKKRPRPSAEAASLLQLPNGEQVPQKFECGTLVEVYWPKTTDHYLATITSVNFDDGTCRYGVKYKDGGRMEGQVEAQRIRLPSMGNSGDEMYKSQNTCPTGHPLMTTKRNGEWICDICELRYEGGMDSNRCTTCDYDACKTCWEASSAPKKVTPVKKGSATKPKTDDSASIKDLTDKVHELEVRLGIRTASDTKAQEDMWTCSRCTLDNPTTKNMCEACESPKPREKEYWTPSQYTPIIIQDFPEQLIGIKYRERFSGFGWFTGTILNIEYDDENQKEGSNFRFHVKYCDGNELMRTQKSMTIALTAWLNKEENEKKLQIPSDMKELILKKIEASQPLQTRSEVAAKNKSTASAKKKPKKTAASNSQGKPQAKSDSSKSGKNEVMRRETTRPQRNAAKREREKYPENKDSNSVSTSIDIKKNPHLHGVPEHKVYQGKVPLLEVTLEYLQESPKKFIGTHFYEYFVGFGDYVGTIKDVDGENNFVVEYNDGTVYEKTPSKMYYVLSLIKKKIEQGKRESEMLTIHNSMLAKKLRIAEEAARSYAQVAKESSKKRNFQQMSGCSENEDPVAEVQNGGSNGFSMEDITENPEAMVGEIFFEYFENYGCCRAKIASVTLPIFQGQQPIFHIEYEDGHSNIKTVKRLYEALLEGKSKSGQRRLAKHGLNHLKTTKTSPKSSENCKQADEKILRWKHGLEVNFEFPLFCGKRLNPYQKFCNAFARSNPFSTMTKRDCLDAANHSWSLWKDDPNINMFLETYSVENAKTNHGFD